MIFWRTNQANKIFLTKKKETFLWTESRNAKDQEIEPQQSIYLQDAHETKETMPKTRKKIHWGNEKNCRKQNCRNCLPGEACSTRKSSKG